MIQQAAGIPFRRILLVSSACETRRSGLRRTIHSRPQADSITQPYPFESLLHLNVIQPPRTKRKTVADGLAHHVLEPVRIVDRP
jgi:hypothetical protein